MLNNEEFYFYYISLSTDFIKFDDYKTWLDKLFEADKNSTNVLLELEFCEDDIEKTIYSLNIYLYDKIEQLDFKEVYILIINELKEQYTNTPNSLKELTHKLYDIWNLLPPKIAQEKPFLIFNSIDDYWDILSKEQIVEKIKCLFDYY